MESRTDRHPTDLAGLRGARFVSAVELQRKVSHYLQPILSHQFLNNLA
jgi:phage/plasmid-associated DNA primase